MCVRVWLCVCVCVCVCVCGAARESRSSPRQITGRAHDRRWHPGDRQRVRASDS